MQKRNAPIIAATLVLAGCAVPTLDDGGARNEVGSVPEAVIALAAPGQDLTTARLRPEDGCGKHLGSATLGRWQPHLHFAPVLISP